MQKICPQEVGLPIYHFGVNKTIGVSSSRVGLGFSTSMLYVKRIFGLIVISLENARSRHISFQRLATTIQASIVILQYFSSALFYSVIESLLFSSLCFNCIFMFPQYLYISFRSHINLDHLHKMVDPEQNLLLDHHWEIYDPILFCSNQEQLPSYCSTQSNVYFQKFKVWELGMPLCIVPQVFHFP